MISREFCEISRTPFLKNTSKWLLVDIATYSGHFQQFKRNRLQGKCWCFSHKCFLIFNDRCSSTLLFLISQMKLTKRTEKLEVDLNIGLRRTVLSTTCTSMRRLWNNLINSMLKMAGQKPAHPILVSRPGLKFFIQRRDKIFPVPLLI